jgi:prepilin-type N-terminal cleavage/methylation domain-containing protein
MFVATFLSNRPSTRLMRPSDRRQHRFGVSLVEVLVVIVLGGILMAISFPRFQRGRDTLDVRSAKQTITAYLAQARATAISNGRVASFVRVGNSVSVVLNDVSGNTVVGNSQNLMLQYGTTFTAPRDTISFDSRGVAIGGPGTLAFVVVKNSVRDSVCLLGLGKVAARSCSL